MPDLPNTSVYNAEQNYRKYKQTLSYFQRKEKEFADKQRNIRLAADSLYRKIEPLLNLADHVLSEEDSIEPEIVIKLHDNENGTCGISFREHGTELPYILVNIHIEDNSLLSTAILSPKKEIPYKLIEFPADMEDDAGKNITDEIFYLNNNYEQYHPVILQFLSNRLDFLTNEKIKREMEKAKEQGMDEKMINGILLEAASLPLKTNERSVQNRLGKIKEQERNKKIQKELEKEAKRAAKSKDFGIERGEE